MQPERYLVIGLAKTGTTVISKTIQNSAGIGRYVLEPKAATDIEALAADARDGIVKILFDHWKDRPHLLDAMVANELGSNFTRTICITRDPRAELVSRLHYMAFTHFMRNDCGEGDIERWVSIFRAKEADPDGVSLQSMFSYLSEHFGAFGDGSMRSAGDMNRAYGHFLARHPELHADVVRYEDFFAGRLEGHPIANLLAGSRETGRTLGRTRRSAGKDDWTAFVVPEDREWLQGIYADTFELLGYDPAAPATKGRIDPERSSRYVERIIIEARKRRADRIARSKSRIAWGLHKAGRLLERMAEVTGLRKA